jgi:hypothetical protein
MHNVDASIFILENNFLTGSEIFDGLLIEGEEKE